MSSQPTPTIEDLWQLVQKQAAEITELRAGQHRSASPNGTGGFPGRGTDKISRAGLLKVAAVGVAATAMAAGSEVLNGATPALANTGSYTDSNSPTLYVDNGSTWVQMA